MPDIELAHKVVDYLNDLVVCDKPAIAALIANRVPCNETLADHQSCQVCVQHGGFHVGMLGILNGLCGVYEKTGNGAIAAIFDEPKNPGEHHSLVGFEVFHQEIINAT